MEEALVALAQSVREVAERMAEVRRTRQELTRDLSQAEGEVGERLQQASLLSNRVSELTTELASQQSRWEKERSDLAAELGGRIAALESERDRLQSELTGRTETLEAEREKIQREIAAEHARTKGTLEAEIAQLKDKVAELEAGRNEAVQAAARAGGERAFLVEEQDRFLKGVMDDYDAKLQQLTRTRDEALARVEQLVRSRDEAFDRATLVMDGPANARRHGVEPTPASSLHPDGQAWPFQAVLGERIRTLEDELERIQHERELSKEVLRRLQAQRDEAHENASRLSREMEALRVEGESRASETKEHPSGAPPRPDPQRATADATVPSAPKLAPLAPVGAATTDGRPRSALAAALAASDPNRRKQKTEPERTPARDGRPMAALGPPRSTIKGPLRAVPEPSRKPPTGTEQEPEPNQAVVKPPRR